MIDSTRAECMKTNCLSYWEEEKRYICILFKIKPWKQEEFEGILINEICYLNNNSNNYIRDFLYFIEQNYRKCETYTVEDNVKELVDMALFSEDFELKEDFRKRRLTLYAIVFVCYFKILEDLRYRMRNHEKQNTRCEN